MIFDKRGITSCSANSTLLAHASLVTAGCEAVRTMYPHSERKVTEAKAEVATTSREVVKGLGLWDMVNIGRDSVLQPKNVIFEFAKP